MTRSRFDVAYQALTEAGCQHSQVRAAYAEAVLSALDAQDSADDVDVLAALIRRVDGNHDLGAGELAERLIQAGVRVGVPATI